MASSQSQRLPAQHFKLVNRLPRQLWQPFNTSALIEQNKSNLGIRRAASGSLDDPDDVSFTESSFPPPRPTTPEPPKDDVASLIYHAGKFIRNPIPYLISLAHFCSSSIALAKQFYKPRLSSSISRSLRVLLVVFIFCSVICLVDSTLFVKIVQYYPRAPAPPPPL